MKREMELKEEISRQCYFENRKENVFSPFNFDLQEKIMKDVADSFNKRITKLRQEIFDRTGIVVLIEHVINNEIQKLLNTKNTTTILASIKITVPYQLLKYLTVEGIKEIQSIIDEIEENIDKKETLIKSRDITEALSEIIMRCRIENIREEEIELEISSEVNRKLNEEYLTNKILNKQIIYSKVIINSFEGIPVTVKEKEGLTVIVHCKNRCLKEYYRIELNEGLNMV